LTFLTNGGGRKVNKIFCPLVSLHQK